MIAPAIEMQERKAPSRPYRLGTRRRPARQARAASEAGASRPEGAASLDTRKQLATTVKNRAERSAQEWADSQKNTWDQYAEQQALRKQLMASVHKLWQDYAAAGEQAAAVQWEKTWFKLRNCQAEWIGYRAACCGGKTRPVAVPIGCNHRLCPLCAWHRSQKARVKIKTMYDRLKHPVMLTFTTPNLKTLRKHDYTLFRQRLRKLIKQREGWIYGGVYSMETTYNRTAKTWHLHAHVLADVSASLPSKEEKIVLAGQTVYMFTAIKLRLEFDWLRLTGGQRGKKPRKGSAMAAAGDDYDFETWVKETREHKVREWRPGGWQPLAGLSAREIERRTKWNADNRRVIDLRPVKDRDGAAREVLKYITKVADFCDVPEAVETFCNAVKGARLIQTFGTWYGINFDTVFDPEHMQDWGEMKCSCGLNHWERMGVFYRRDVEMDSTGRWLLVRSIHHNARGTVPRPTIRALDTVPESEMEQLCTAMERR